MNNVLENRNTTLMGPSYLDSATVWLTVDLDFQNDRIHRFNLRRGQTAAYAV